MTTILKSVLLISILFAFGCGARHSAVHEPGKHIALHIEPSQNNPRNSEGDFIRLNDGRWLFVYTHFTGGAGDAASAYLAGRFSADDGKTWSEKDTLILPNEGKQNIMSVSLIRLPDGRIALFYLRKDSDESCLPLMRTSDDEGASWSDPAVCVHENGYYVMNNDRTVILRDGRIILPLALHTRPGLKGWHNGLIMCYYSDDQGITWQKGKEAENPENVTSQEPGVVELSDGKLMLFCRTNAGSQYISFSDDRGESWSPLAPGNIPSPLSPATIESIPSTGDLLLVWNNNPPSNPGEGKRTPLNIAISKNDGKSWGKIKELENDPNGWYCYTAMDFTDDHVLLAYCAGDRRKYNGLETTQITRLSLDWIYADATPPPEVLSDKNGLVTLGTHEKTTIYYTLDGSYPTINTAQKYQKPIEVGKTTLLKMFAVEDGRPPSNLVTVHVGKDKLLPPIDTLTITVPGLRYQYYEGEFVHTDQISENFIVKEGIMDSFSIAPQMRDQFFAFTYEGILKIEKDGTYTFYLTSNDGSVLFIDGYKIVDNDGRHGAGEAKGIVSLAKGLHGIALKYFQAGGDKMLKISWAATGAEKDNIPSNILFH